ncbi:MAG: pyruvate formate lyase 1-activating protein, partial [Clostridia bacterium]|nr:pyruvate formate lyase 1-activating protein [Clostridia bacterium]
FLDTLPNAVKTEVLPYHTMGEAKYEKLGIEYPLKGVLPPTAERIANAKRILCGSDTEEKEEKEKEI